MAVTYGFYNALNHDRLYDAIQMSSIFDGIIRDGIFSTIGDTMIVTAPEDGLYVNVGSGRAWFNHTWTLNDTDYPIEAEEAEVVLDRIDAVILEVNSSAEVRANSIKFLKGTPSSNPVKPTLTHNAEVNQYALAYVRIRAGQTTIFQSDIENAVGTDETPFITGVLQQVSIETLLKQWEAEFNTYFTNFKNTSTTEFNNWFATKVSEYTAWFAQMQTDMDSNFNEFDAWFQRMKDQLDENQAGHLQLQIDNLSGRIDDLDAEMPFAGGSKVNINFEYVVVPNVQYSNEHYKLTVGDTVRENNFSSSKLHFDEYGILTVGDGILEVTYDVTDSRTGKITHASYTYTINMPYFGRFAYNVTISASLYNYQGWLESIGKDASSYSTIEDVFADEKLLRELMTRHASVDYLVEWLANNNEDAHTVLNNDYCAKWINLRDYALDKLYANPTVKTVMDEVDKYGYGEWALVNQVPKMTSNVAPSGRVVFSNNLINNSQAYLAFDGNETDSSRWHASKQDGTYIGYEFDEPKIIQAFRINADHSSTLGAYIKTFVIKGRNTDSESWVDLTDIITANDSKTSNVVTVGKMNSEGVAYKQIAVFPLSSYADEYRLYEVQFYAWGPKGNVPVMTSNTAPYGETIYDSIYSTNYPYNVFDNNDSTSWSQSTASVPSYIGYKFTNPIMCKRLKITIVANSTYGLTAKDYIIQASNDGNTWIDLTTGTLENSLEDVTKEINFENEGYYLYYRFYITSKYFTESGFVVRALQFYGRELTDTITPLTSNTNDKVIFSGNELSNNPQYKAFDGDASTYWYTSLSSGTPTLELTLNEEVKASSVQIILSGSSSTAFAYTQVLSAYVDGEWVELGRYTTASITQSQKDKRVIAFNQKNISKLRLTSTRSGNAQVSAYVATVNLFSLDYSEHTERHWMYDHGVELEPLVGFKNQNGDLVDTDSYEYLYMEKKVSAAGNVAVRTVSQIDLTNYALMRAKVGNIFVGGNNAIFVINLQTPNTADAAIAASGFNANNLPDNNALDLSNINQSLYCDVGLVESNTVTRKQSITEWWLE